MDDFINIAFSNAKSKYGDGWSSIGREFQEAVLGYELLQVIGLQDTDLDTEISDWKKPVELVEIFHDFLAMSELT